MTRPRNGQDERTPLLQRSDSYEQESGDVQVDTNILAWELDFSKEDPENPRQWSYRRKMANVITISMMAILSPLASSMFSPGMLQIAECLNTTKAMVTGATTGFVVLLGIGPLILAPLSETFGRRKIYLVCFTIFSLLQIPTALSPNIETMIVVRTFSGFFGSVGIANGGGTVSDMFPPSERAEVLGVYLLGPALGPTLGPLFGGLIVDNLGWRWVFWVLTIVCMTNTLLGFLFLKETYAPVILAKRCRDASKTYGGHFTFPGEDDRALHQRLTSSIQRPIRILFTQPIIATMAAYQAVIFASMYSLFTNMDSIFHMEPYNLNTTQVGLLFLGPGLGFFLGVWFLVPQIDTVFNTLTARNKGVSKPEYRLPLANIGSFLLPLTLFWFGWTIEYSVHWAAPICATVFYGLGQVAIFNCVQNYYIDAFPQFAASAIAAGAVTRSLVGGIVPLFASGLFERLGYGWGWSTFGFLIMFLSPSPFLFMRYGEKLRKRFAIDL
ncbi:MAG: hypothetical protein M1831_003196 [Alyxoria varia]|nr:MAG: hypothetical protein M1831_003196 [Alyxoria varia]